MDKQLRLQVILAIADKALRPLKAIGKGSQDAAKQLRAARDAVKALERAQADVSRAKALEESIVSLGVKMAATRDKAAKLRAEYHATDAPSKRLTENYKKAREAVARLQEKQTAEVRTLGELRDRLSAAGHDAGNFAAAEATLARQTAKANGELELQQKRLKAIGDRQAQMSAASDRYSKSQAMAGNIASAGIGAGAAGAAILAPAKSAFDKHAAFQSGMTDIGQKADTTRAQVKALGAEVLRISKATNQTPEAVREGVDSLAGLGLDPKDAMKMIDPIGRVATAYKADMDDVSKAAFAAHDNLKIPLDQTAKTLDVMAYAGKRGAFELKDMAQYFPQLTAASQGLGQTGVRAGADLAAALQITRKGAGDAASAATNLDNLLQKIASPTTTKNFAKMGINLEAEMKKAAAAGKTPIEAITELTNKAVKGDLSKLGYLFEDAQVQKALRPLIQNFEEYKAIRADALKASGVTDSDFAQRMQDDAEKTKEASIAVNALQLQLGAQLAPTIVKVAAVAGGLADRFSTWATNHPKLSAALATSALVLGGLLVAFGLLAVIVAAVLGPFALMQFAFVGAAPVFLKLAQGVMFLSRAFFTFGASLLMNPITWIVLAIVAAVALLAGAAYLIYKNWGPISDWFAGIWERIKAHPLRALAAIAGFILKFSPVGLFMQAFAALWPYLASLGAKFKQLGVQMITGLIDGIVSRLSKIKETVAGVAHAAVGAIKAALGIHSPSRVFAGIGGYTMAGLEQGIVKGQAGPLDAIRRTAGVMAAGMALTASGVAPAAADAVSSVAAGPGFSPPSRSASAAGGRYEIHIHPQPGMDPEAIARAVAAELDRRERLKAGERGASYHDEE